MIDILDGNQAAAWGAKLCRVDHVPCFPITPQTELIETIAKWKADGEFKGEFNQVEGEHSVLSAAFGSSLVGARTFTATSSQGLLYMHEMLPIVSGCRLPVVMVNVSRALSAPISLWPDHNDFLSMRDSGWLMLACENNQEVLDSVIMSFKISEKVLLPSLVNMDGFVHSFTREEVDVPKQRKVDKFLPKLNMKIKMDTKKPKTFGTPVMHEYLYFRSQHHKASLDALKVIKKIHNEWYKLTGRKYDVIDCYKTKDAKTVLVIIGSTATIAKHAVDLLRAKGKKVGVLRLRYLRPFPKDEIKQVLKGKKVKIFDQNVAPGFGGILFSEISSLEIKCDSYVGGLGGIPVSEKDFMNIFMDDGGRKWILGK